jgi:putative ABC transport system permease protein
VELFQQAVVALRRNAFRSILTILGIIWGITAVSMLQAYGDGFRRSLVRAFEAFGPDVVMVWPGQTSEQAGGERPAAASSSIWTRSASEEGNLGRSVSPEFLGPGCQRLSPDWRGVRAVRLVTASSGNETPAAGRFLSEE